jgi:hypothetical protein
MTKPLFCVTDELQLEATALVGEAKIEVVVALPVKRRSAIPKIE